jgi:hypothetical protein
MEGGSGEGDWREWGRDDEWIEPEWGETSQAGNMGMGAFGPRRSARPRAGLDKHELNRGIPAQRAPASGAKSLAREDAESSSPRAEREWGAALRRGIGRNRAGILGGAEPATRDFHFRQPLLIFPPGSTSHGRPLTIYILHSGLLVNFSLVSPCSPLSTFPINSPRKHRAQIPIHSPS